MSAQPDDETTDTGHAPKGHKGPKWLNGPHRDEILVVSSVVLVCLGWLTLRKTGTAAASSGTAATSYLGPTGAAQSGIGAVAGSDAAAFQGLQTLLANQSDSLARLESTVSSVIPTGTPTNTPSALAAGLFGPSHSANLVRDSAGSVFEVQSDGSLYGLTRNQLDSEVARGQAAGNLSWNQLSTAMPVKFSTETNLARVNAAATP